MNTFDSGIYKGSRKVYPYYIGNRTGINIVDFSAGGRTLAFPATPGDFTNSITNPTAPCYYQNIPSDTDFITIYLGINDSHHASGGGDGEDTTGYIPLGTVDDTTTASFGGAWNVVLSWLITNRPNAHIGIIVSNGCDSDDYRTLTIAIAEKYGIPYIDLNGDQTTPAMIRTTNPAIDASVKAALINKWAVAAPSNTHPNDDAHEFESHCIEAFLRRL
jgi:lysophospholipase L1-like esterase